MVRRRRFRMRTICILPAHSIAKSTQLYINPNHHLRRSVSLNHEDASPSITRLIKCITSFLMTPPLSRLQTSLYSFYSSPHLSQKQTTTLTSTLSLGSGTSSIPSKLKLACGVCVHLGNPSPSSSLLSKSLSSTASSGS
jgi:hypothetical protein